MKHCGFPTKEYGRPCPATVFLYGSTVTHSTVPYALNYRIPLTTVYLEDAGAAEVRDGCHNGLHGGREARGAGDGIDWNRREGLITGSGVGSSDYGRRSSQFDWQTPIVQFMSTNDEAPKNWGILNRSFNKFVKNYLPRHLRFTKCIYPLKSVIG